jgi:chitin disaccharide deacetylase
VQIRYCIWDLSSGTHDDTITTVCHTGHRTKQPGGLLLSCAFSAQAVLGYFSTRHHRAPTGSAAQLDHPARIRAKSGAVHAKAILMRPLAAAFLTVVVGVAAFSFAVWRTKLPERYVIIHADDAGMYPAVNRATIDAMERGIVSSSSIMVPCPGFPDFARYAATHSDRDFGVHLTLNCETEIYRWGPVCGSQNVPSLVDPDGFFWTTTAETASHARIDEVDRELRAQIDKALAAGIRISHLDHHMFVLFERPDLLRLYIKLSALYDLPVRYLRDIPADQLDARDPAIVAEYRRGSDALQSRRMPLLDEIESAYGLAPERKRDHYFAKIQTLKPGVTELSIHCAYRDVGLVRVPGGDRREADAHVFMSDEMAGWVRRCGVRIIDWKSLRKLTATGTLP